MKGETAIIHGRRVNYTQAGSGPVLLLIHGMAGDASHWSRFSRCSPAITP